MLLRNEIVHLTCGVHGEATFNANCGWLRRILVLDDTLKRFMVVCCDVAIVSVPRKACQFDKVEKAVRGDTLYETIFSQEQRA